MLISSQIQSWNLWRKELYGVPERSNAQQLKKNVAKENPSQNTWSWGDNSLMEQLLKWQTNSEQLIANIYLQYCMNCAIKTQITCIFFSLTPVNSPWIVSQSFTKYIHFKLCITDKKSNYLLDTKNCEKLSMILYWYPVSSAHTQLDSGSIMNAPGTAGTITVQIKTSRPGNCHSFFPGGFDFSSICPSLVLFEVFLGSLEILIQTNPKYVLCDFFF